MQESLSADDWNEMDVDDENFYDECDSTAGLGDATCDSGHVASSTGSSNSSPEQQQRLNNLSRFGGSGGGGGGGGGSGGGGGVGASSGGYRQKNSSKMKLLVRSHALREAASPPPDSPTPSSLSPTNELQGSLSPRESADSNLDSTSGPEGPKVSSRPRTRHAGGSSQCSVDSSASFVSFSLSRDSSAELGSGTGGNHTYTDNTGVDLHHFIIETLHRNYKDRTTLLRIEQEMVTLVRDSKRTCHRFPAMSSYHRMLVHRVAAYFGLEHNVDQSGNCVVVSKSVHTRLPDVPFKQYVRDDLILPEEPNKKSSLRREAVSFDELHASGRYRSPEIRSRSFEEREGECGRLTRNRTFHPQTSWNSSQEKDGSESAYNTSSHRTSHDDIRYSQPRKFAPQGILRTNRIPKVESFDSRDLLCNYGNSLRPAVAKSYSFGGYTAPPTGEGALVRGESVPTGSAAAQHHSPKLLSKQDSNSSSVSISRSSPTSSGYKSQQSVSAAPSPSPIMSRASSSRHPPAASSNSSVESQSTVPPEWIHPPKQQTEAVVDNVSSSSLLWAVTSLDAVPSGSILINPNTGQPFYNTDGSVYRYDPNQPLPFQMENTSGAACQPSVVGDEINIPQTQAGPELLQTYESYDENSSGKVEVYAENNAPALSSVPMYQTWPPSYYDGATATPTASPGPYGQTIQPYYNEFHPSLNSANGYYLAHPTSVADDQMKTLTAVPLPHGQGYFVYQACVAPPPDAISSSHVDSELNPLLKNLSLRPLLPVPYPSIGMDGISQPADINPMHSVYVPVTSVRAGNPQLGKIQVSTGVSGTAAGVGSGPSGARATFSSSAPTPTPSATSVSSSLMAPNSFMTSIRVHNSGHVISPPSYPAASPYAPVVYPLPNQTPAAQPNGQHYISASVVHHYNNAQYVSQPRPLLLSSPTPSRCRTPDREGGGSGDVAVTRMIHGSLPSNRFPFVYGSSLGSPVLSGDIRTLRPSPAFFHRQYSLPSPQSQGLYALRPRLQPQLTLAGPHVVNPNTPLHHQGNMALASRPPRMRRQSSSRNNLSGGIVSASSATPTQSCSSSPIQHQTTSS